MGWRQEQQPGGKSLWKALFLWATGGLFGLHHVYLERDRHAFVCWSSFGGMGLAWLADLFSLPRYVREANLDPSYLEEFTEKLRTQPKVSKNYGLYFHLSCLITYVFVLAVFLSDMSRFVSNKYVLQNNIFCGESREKAAGGVISPPLNLVKYLHAI